MTQKQNAEQLRIAEIGKGPVPIWHKWGPYVSERAWGTVREDYSDHGDAWSFFPFEEAHRRVYRWGEDGIAGWCDRYQVLLLSFAFWNGKDPILKERLFGLTTVEGNHGEDVKECYYYLDGTPSHSYMKYLYKYPFEPYPYELLKTENSKRGVDVSEYELIDTGIFANGYFDIVIEYAKASAEDLCIRVEIFNRNDKESSLHLLPQLWFRNQWSWEEPPLPKPTISNGSSHLPCLVADDTKLRSPPNLPFDYHLGKRYFYGPQGGAPLFADNENDSPHPKDAFHRAIIQKEPSTNPKEVGTKAALHYFLESIPAFGSTVVHFRFSPKKEKAPLKEIDAIVQTRKKEADAFYTSLHPLHATEEEKRVQRQALAGMVWTKQFYFFDVNQWFKGDRLHSASSHRPKLRNTHWRHLNSMRVLSMPDKWEFPWFAAWDLAFHCLPLGLIDIECAKEQLWLLLFDQFQHPNGAIPAYEWEFSDLNPPLQAWAAYHLYTMQKEKTGTEDRAFLKKCFLKLLLNFNFWVNRVDSSGCNIFEGGFLGLDNIALLDRSERLEGGAILKQSDGTGWMAMFCLNLMRISLELAKEDPSYQAMATKFFQHFVYIADAMGKMGDKQYNMWCSDDGFFHDILVHPDGNFSRFPVRSLVGLIPLYAVEILDKKELEQFPQFKSEFLWFLENRKELTNECVLTKRGHYLLALVNEARLKSLLRYIWDPKEFRSPFGVRSLSKFHEQNPFVYQEMKINYEPGEAVSKIKGGNSNWRGPLWFPTTYLLLDALKLFARSLGPSFRINVKGEPAVTIEQMVHSIADRMISIFTPDKEGRRPFWGPSFPFTKDPHFKDLILFNEYYHAETGQGLGASHQTGWSGLVAKLIDEFRRDA